MTIVRTKTPAGEAIVILPEAEFERLIALAEDVMDTRAIAVSRSRLDAGEDDLLTLGDLDRLRAAATPLAFWRERRGVTTTALAALTGLDESVIVAMERNEGMAEPGRYRTLAKALAIDVEDLMPTAEDLLPKAMAE